MEINTYTIKELMAQGVPMDKILEICDGLYDMTDFVCADYPKHKSWFYQKHLPATLEENSGRDIVFACDAEENMYGTAFIKKDEEEKKICTLFVREDARGMGVATQLVERSMEILETTKPMITLADYKLPMFEGLIEKYDWERTQEISGLYNDRSTEFVYNGFLPESDASTDIPEQ